MRTLQHVDVIAHEIRRLDEVVQGFLKFSRPEDLKLQPVPLNTLLDEVVPIVRPEAERAGVALIVECGGVPDVNGDPAMLRQAFLNLALNACQAMPAGGTLRVRCESARGRRVAVSFTDTGVGIAPANLQRIFDLYFTTKEGGSGIGLSMVYRAVQLHDGEIEVQSTPGRGTTFRIVLPQANQRMSKSRAACSAADRCRAAVGLRTTQAKSGAGDAGARHAGAAAARRRADRGGSAAAGRRCPRSPRAIRLRVRGRRRRRPSAEPQKPEPPKPEPAPVEPPKPAEEPPKPQTTLQTTPAGAEGEVERSIRTTLARAAADLTRVDYRVLNADARTQYDTAKRFIQQAEEAIRAKNLVFAKNLADKAAALAAQLAGRT